MSKVDEIRELIMKGKAKAIAQAVEDAIKEGADANELLNEGMIGAMDEIGQKFTEGKIFVPEMLISAKAMKKGVEALKPHLSADAAAGLGTVVIGTVLGDLHDIGKNLVAMMLESAGFEVIDLGVDVSPEKFLETAKANANTKIICCSALLTTTMPNIGATVKAFDDAGMRDKVKIMIGGAPVTQKYCDEIGADIYTADAAAAAAKAKEIVA